MNLDDFLENDERREVQLLQLLLRRGLPVACTQPPSQRWGCQQAQWEQPSPHFSSGLEASMLPLILA